MIGRLALAALLLGPGFAAAAETELSSKIDRVTVYPDGAVVTRLGRVELMAGASQIVLRGLPASVDPASIRIEGQSAGDGAGGFAIGAVDVRLAPGAAQSGLDPAIEGKLKALREEKAMLDGRTSAIEGKRGAIERFALVGPDRLGPDGKPLPIGEWPAVFDAIGAALAKVHEELRGVRTRATEIDAEIAVLERARPPGGRPGAPRRDILVAVEAQGPVAARFSVSYRVTGANWTPQYEARLSTGSAAVKPEVAFVRRAELRQRSGEDWGDVALTLSTTRSAGGASAPELPPMQVAFFEPPVLYESRPRASAAPAFAPQAPARREADAPGKLAEPRQAETATATLEAGAYQASFQVPGRATIPQDGSARMVVLSQERFAPALQARITPELEERAYLEAAFVHEDEAPLLPGEVLLHRDGTYVGRGRVGLVAPGDRLALGFGADDRLKVSRAPVRRRENEPTWLGQTRTDLREFRTVVRSLHAQPVKVTLSERVPFSESSAITVETLPQTTPPSEKQVGDRRGVMAWSFDLAPGAEKEVRLAYRVKWPGDRELSYEPRPVR